MSLTSFLELPEVKEKFQQEFEVPKLAAKKEIQAPPLSSRYRLVGIAFDYLLRFWLQRHNDKVISRPWVAERACELLYGHNADADNRIYSNDGKVVGTIDGKPPAPLDPAFTEASRLLDQARKEHELYLSFGKLTDKLIRTTIHLAQLDFIYRDGYIDKNLGHVYPKDVQDLRTLITLVKSELFRAKNLCLLNPTFGKASELINGADADLVIDDMIIDVKTTKDFRLEPKHFFQLLGYYTLYTIAGFEGSMLELDITRPLLTKPVLRPRITKVAIYFSRQAHFEVFDLQAILNKEKFSKFVKWFSGRTKQYFKDT
jgi:hypothetical protein